MRYRRLSYRYKEAVGPLGSQFLGDFWSTKLTINFARTQWRPLADFYETPHALIVKAEVPGVAEENLEVIVYDDVLVIEGIRQWNLPDEDAVFHVLEIHYGPFRLEVPFAAGVDLERIEARYNFGFLTVKMPKLEESSL